MFSNTSRPALRHILGGKNFSLKLWCWNFVAHHFFREHIVLQKNRRAVQARQHGLPSIGFIYKQDELRRSELHRYEWHDLYLLLAAKDLFYLGEFSVSASCHYWSKIRETSSGNSLPVSVKWFDLIEGSSPLRWSMWVCLGPVCLNLLHTS
jgi:hypothetical protein